jgi:hypothetical protein
MVLPKTLRSAIDRYNRSRMTLLRQIKRQFRLMRMLRLVLLLRFRRSDFPHSY